MAMTAAAQRSSFFFMLYGLIFDFANRTSESCDYELTLNGG